MQTGVMIGPEPESIHCMSLEAGGNPAKEARTKWLMGSQGNSFAKT